MSKTSLKLIPVLLIASLAMAQELVSFSTADGAVIFADRYGNDLHAPAVILAHGARFNKESWRKQAETIRAAGFLVLAIDFRGYGQSKAKTPNTGDLSGFDQDILGAVRYLRANGATSVAVVGASMGGYAAAQASTEAKPGEIDRLILLAQPGIQHPERMQGRKLFIVARNDSQGSGTPRLPQIREQYEKAPGPKELEVLEGSAHAQALFDTDQGERLMHEILRFLSAP